jgi:hypothetical protein
MEELLKRLGLSVARGVPQMATGFVDLAEARKRVMQSQVTVIDNLTGLGLLESRVLPFDIYINNHT